MIEYNSDYHIKSLLLIKVIRVDCLFWFCHPWIWTVGFIHMWSDRAPPPPSPAPAFAQPPCPHPSSCRHNPAHPSAAMPTRSIHLPPTRRGRGLGWSATPSTPTVPPPWLRGGRRGEGGIVPTKHNNGWHVATADGRWRASMNGHERRRFSRLLHQQRILHQWPWIRSLLLFHPSMYAHPQSGHRRPLGLLHLGRHHLLQGIGTPPPQSRCTVLLTSVQMHCPTHALHSSVGHLLGLARYTKTVVLCGGFWDSILAV
jgi:hypothetical protein